MILSPAAPTALGVRQIKIVQSRVRARNVALPINVGRDLPVKIKLRRAITVNATILVQTGSVKQIEAGSAMNLTENMKKNANKAVNG